jgi:hypothetical protein
MKSLANEVAKLGQTVLVLQGGGALGAYQVGVYEALHEAGVTPDWIIGTSIGLATAGIVMGWAGVALTVAGLLCACVFMVLPLLGIPFFAVFGNN